MSVEYIVSIPALAMFAVKLRRKKQKYSYRIEGSKVKCGLILAMHSLDVQQGKD